MVKKKYSDQIEKARELTSNNDAIRVYVATINDERCVVGIMNFAFIGGSLGSVVGQKISLGIDYASQNNLPLIIVCSSGGARMQEGVISLMQLAKISTRLAEFSKKTTNPLHLILFLVNILELNI